LKPAARAISALLLLFGVTACGGSDAGDAAPVAPPRLLLLVERADGGSDAALEARLSALANDTAACGWLFTPPPDGVPERTVVLYEPAYGEVARDVALLFSLDSERLVPVPPGSSEAAVVLVLGADYDLETLAPWPDGLTPVISPDELSGMGYGEGTVIYVDISHALRGRPAGEDLAGGRRRTRVAHAPRRVRNYPPEGKPDLELGGPEISARRPGERPRLALGRHRPPDLRHARDQRAGLHRHRRQPRLRPVPEFGYRGGLRLPFAGRHGHLGGVGGIMLNVPEEELRRLCGRWGIQRLSLFGSVLRGESGPESDVDLLVEFEAGARITLLDFVNIRGELGRLFDRRIDLISKRGLKNSGNAMRREEILNTARTIYEKA